MPAAALLPATYCDVSACQQLEGCGLAEGYNLLSPALVDLQARGQCHWASVRSFEGVQMCTHDPAVDTQVSSYLHSRGSWIAVEELAAFKQVACSSSRPFMLDVGSNIGSYSVPAAALGCSVVSFDPSLENLGRVVESMRRLGALGRTQQYLNFVGAVHSHRTVVVNRDNMGGTTFARGAGGGANASFVVLDEFFSSPLRPISPLSGQPVHPREVQFIKVDAEGCDMEIFYSAQRLLQEGQVPFLTIEFSQSNNCQATCQAAGFLDHMYALGYSFYEPYVAQPRAIGRGEVPSGTLEWWFVHKHASLPAGWV